MGEKLDESQNTSTEDKDVAEVLGGAAIPENGSQDDADPNRDRRIMAAQHNLKNEGFFVRFLKWMFYIPMKVLSVFGFTFGKSRLQLSGNAAIDKSPLRAPSASPHKRKRNEGSVSTDDEIDDDEVALKLLQDDADYNSQEDEDYKPGESSCSDEFTEEGDTEGELSKLSIEDVTEPRRSKLRNPDGENRATKEASELVQQEKVKLLQTVVPKCIDDPLTNSEMTPATVGVMG